RRNAPRRLNDIPQNRSAAAITPKRRGKRLKCYEANTFLQADIDQAFDYAADLKYFHEGSHPLPVVPILVATHARPVPNSLVRHSLVPGLFRTICTNADSLRGVVSHLLDSMQSTSIDTRAWESSRYCPTPTIVEAARALYAGHGVAEISRNDAGAKNLHETSEMLASIIDESRKAKRKSISFVTGVPGAGKTLVGLNIATQFHDSESDRHSVFLSGNGPLVAILREALARDSIRRERQQGNSLKKSDAKTRVKAFIQNVHHFRDECLRDALRPPVDHVALFDEAQRAWTLQQTASFMRRKKGVNAFQMSEPEFLISCMDRHRDWAVIVCLVGGGQEINTGEAGIAEWIDVLRTKFHDWRVYISPALTDSEYGAGATLAKLAQRPNVTYCRELHLNTSMRSFRAENVSTFIKHLLDCDSDSARLLLKEFDTRYPVRLTRDLSAAKQWLRDHAAGSERYGIIVSSQAERLKPLALDVRTPVDPVKWFLDGKEDVRSSYFLEDVATEFHVQGLELDWACVSWDGDFRFSNGEWEHFSFRGSKWQRINKRDRRQYLKNAYRVLLTRARQGMVICVPEGSEIDHTRRPQYYDSTYEYLLSIGIQQL
ncbi:MAG: DUF2075 domain-containing protein, partial [Candidatus Hydrogenedentes bacterium]|nr:DUF2075 domain-containing protein [Candidatus Hydrogenedentota bacterium]